MFRATFYERAAELVKGAEARVYKLRELLLGVHRLHACGHGIEHERGVVVRDDSQGVVVGRDEDADAVARGGEELVEV